MALGHWLKDYIGPHSSGSGGGGGGGALSLMLDHYDERDRAWFNRTWNEVNTAMRSGSPCFVLSIDDEDETLHILQYAVVEVYYNTGDGYTVSYKDSNGDYVNIVADTADGYLHTQGD